MPRIPFIFPDKGQDENTNYPLQPPNTSSDCDNVRVFDSIKKRQRGGSRPGLNRWYFAKVNGTQRIVSLTKSVEAQVIPGTARSYEIIVAGTTTSKDMVVYDEDFVEGPSANITDWNDSGCAVGSIAGNFYLSGGIATGTDKKARKTNSAGSTTWTSIADVAGGVCAYDEENSMLCCVVDALTTVKGLQDSDGVVQWTTDIGKEGTDMAYHQGHVYVVCQTNTAYAGAGDTKSVFKLDGSDGSIIATFDTGASLTAASNNRGPRITISKAGMIVVSNAVQTASYDGAGDSANMFVLDPDLNLVTAFHDGYAHTGSKPNFRSVAITRDKRILSCTDNNRFFVHNQRGVFIQSFFTDLDIIDDVHTSMVCDENGSVYLGGLTTDATDAAGLLPAGPYSMMKLSTSTFLFTAGVKFSAGGIKNFMKRRLAAASLSTRITSLTITDDSGDVSLIEDGTKKVVTTGSTALTADVFKHKAANAYSKVFMVDGTNMKVLSLANDTVSTWTATSAGTLPSAARLIARWRGRVVLSGLAADPHNWFMSRVGDPFDWDYSPSTTDAIQAVAGNIGEVGLFGDIVTALCPFDDDVLVVGMDQSIAKIAGDPAAGGAIDVISTDTGMAWDAWTLDPDNNLWFMGIDGIYMMGKDTVPVNMTRDQLDSAFEAIDLEKNRVILSWDFRNKGLVVVVANIASASANQAYFYENRTGGWFPMAWPTTMGPDCMLAYDADLPEDKAMLLGCRDGFIRQVTTNDVTDDGTAIATNVRFLPIGTRRGSDSRLKGLEIDLAEGSADVTLKIYSGSTAEQCAIGTKIRWSRTLKAGKNIMTLPRVSGAWMQLELVTTSGRWALESIFGLFEEGGRTRQQKRT